MAIRNPNWYNSHESRRFPLDDNATGTGDDGTRINDDVISDIRLRWPRIAGQFAYLAGLTVTDKIVTAVILAADETDSAAVPTPLAAVTIPQPVTRHRYYNFEPLYPGVGGFIAFGDPAEPFSIRFATPQQGLLAPAAATPYDKLPVSSMGKLGRPDPLTGLVKILGGRDIEVVKEQVVFDGMDYDALVIRLVAPTTNDNVLKEYSGPCNARPESRSCRKEGVETINGVAPDCDGNIEIQFVGMTAGPYESCGSEMAGVTLDQSIGIEEVCADTSPERFVGEDLCAPSVSSSSLSLSSESLPSESDPSSSAGSLSSESLSCEDLPFVEEFNGTMHADWLLKIGGTAFYEGQAVVLNNPSRRQALVWEDCAIATALSKRVTTNLQLTNAAPQVNGGLVLNYRIVDPLTNSHVEYFLLQLNRNANRVELLRFNGNGFVLENSANPPLPFSLQDVFSVEATITPAGDQVAIAAKVKNVTSPAWGQVTFTVLTSQFGNGVGGQYGVGNNRSITRFFTWGIDNA